MAAGLSPKFAEILANGDGYQMVARLEVRNPHGVTILDSDTSTILYVAGGSITVDGSASITRSITDLQVVDPTYTLVPTSKASYFSPASNNEVVVYIGAMIDGSPEYVQQGVFSLEGAKVEDSAAGLTITISAYDRAMRYARSKRYTDRKFLASGDVTWPGGWPVREAITALLRDAYPGTTVNHDSPTALLPEQVVRQGEDPWQMAQSWAEAIGYDLFFDRYGQCQLRKVPDPNDPNMPIIWQYAEGEGGLLGTVRSQSNQGIINGCAVTGMNPSNGSAVRSDMLWDDDPDSATYYLGPFGKVPELIQSDKVRDIGAANDMARAHINKHKGLIEAVEFSIVPNPAIDPLDTVQLTRERSGFSATGAGSEALIVDRYSISMSATGGAMTVSCRQRRRSG